MKNKTFISQQPLHEEWVESDIVVCIPPKKRYTIELTVRNIRKAQPRIVEPETKKMHRKRIKK